MTKPTTTIVIFAVVLAGTYVAVNKLFSSQLAMAPAQMTHTRLLNLEQGLRMYRFDYHKYPVTAEGLRSLLYDPVSGDPWKVPYIDQKNLFDEWGERFQYTSDGNIVEIVSKGPDKSADTFDDIMKSFQ